jgi:sugar O-acyltransferase (sialic acid O-acetyltransferase NeuD family)
MQTIFVVGASGHARVVIDILEKQERHRIAGLIDSYAPLDTKNLGYRVLGTENDLPELLCRYSAVGGIVAIGDNFVRHSMVERILQLAPNFEFVTAIHPSAEIGRGAVIGAGTAIMAEAVINPNARVGRHCIVNTYASLDHDSTMGDFSSLGPGATTGGGVHVGEFSVLAQRANVIHGIQIGAHSVVGTGSTVLKNVPGCVVVYGTPARAVRTRTPGEKYL